MEWDDKRPAHSSEIASLRADLKKGEVMSKRKGSATSDGTGTPKATDEIAASGEEPLFATRRLALGTAAAATAGFLADRALSPDPALAAEGVTSVNGKTGVVVLTAASVEASASLTAQAVAISNVETKGIPSKNLTDEVTLAEGQLVLLTKQATASENGVWVVKGGTTKWTRPSGFATASEQYGVLVPIVGGELHAGSMWLLKNATKVTVGTTAQEWEENSAGTGRPFIFGINGNYTDYSTWVPANVIGDRGGNINESGTTNGLGIEYNASTSERERLVTYVGERLAKGMVSDVIVDCTSLSSVTASTYSADFLAIIKGVLVAHPTTAVAFEIINEPYFKTTESASLKRYAEICTATYEAVEKAFSKKELGELTTMPTLLVAAWGRYSYHEGGKEYYSNPEAGRGWLRDLLKEWPAGKKKINGFYSHPYNGEVAGPLSVVSNGQTVGYRAVASEHQIAVEEGCSGADNFWVTEYGWNRTDLPGSTEVIREAEQAEKMQEALELAWQFYAEGWLKASLVYLNFGYGEEAGLGLYGTLSQGVLTGFANARRAPLFDIAIPSWPSPGIYNGPLVNISGISSALGKQYVPNALHPTLVNATVTLEKGKAASAVALITNPEAGEGGEHGGLEVAEASTEATSASSTTLPLMFMVPPGWKWQITGANAKVVKVSYQVV
jgi:hypothetical protein